MMKIVFQVSGNLGAASDPATYGFIGSGFNNCIDTAAGAGTTFGVIGGGEGNYVGPGTNHSSIFSGNGNQVSGSCSSILGGTNNSDGGFDNVFIAGSGITGVAPDTLHVNALWANGMPTYPGGFPYLTGTVFVVPVGTPPPAGITGALYIM